MIDINKRKVRNHHRLIATIKQFHAANGDDVAMPLTYLETVWVGIDNASNLLVRPNAWMTFAEANEDAIIHSSARGTKNQTYKLLNAFAFDDSGRRFATPAGNRLLTDVEIKLMLLDIAVDVEAGYATENGERFDTLAADAPVVPSNFGLQFYQGATDVSTVDVVTLADDGPIDAMTLFSDDSEVITDVQPDLAEPEIVDYTQVTDNSFPLDSVDVEPYVADVEVHTVVETKPTSRKRDKNGHFVKREAA